MARNRSKAAAAAPKHAPRRKSIPGQKLPRKMYPRITAAQKKAGVAPAMADFINRNRVGLENQGNARGALDAQRRMKRAKSHGDLRSNWGRAVSKGEGRANASRLMRQQGLSRREIKSALGDAHKVQFAADPRNS